MALSRWRAALRSWAAALAAYALILHAPAMAAFGHELAGEAVAVMAHGHGDEAAAASAAAAAHDARSCCTICGGGPCAVGPSNSGGIPLPQPRLRSRRLRITRRDGIPRGERPVWFRARGPPPAA